MNVRKLVAYIMTLFFVLTVSMPILAADADIVKSERRIMGDVSGDGILNTGDATIILKACSDAVVLTESQLEVADANMDGVFNTGDATYVLRVVVGLEEAYYLEDDVEMYEISYVSGLAGGIDVDLPESTMVTEGAEFTITRVAFSEGLSFIGWQADFDGNIYNVNDKFVMPSRNVVLMARWEGVEPVLPSAEPTVSPSVEPTTSPSGEPTETPTGNPTMTPTTEPTPTDEPVYGNIVYLPGEDSVNGGGVQEGSMPETQNAEVGKYAVIPKDKIPHSVTLQAGESNAYAFICWEDENGTEYYAGDTIYIEDTDTITLTAQWESGYQVLTSPADIEQYVFENLSNKVILGSDITLYYYNTAYFYPIGFDSDGSSYNTILYEGAFTGKFDGAGYTIYNLTCEYASSDICSAFFYINEGTVSNFTFKLNQLYSQGRLMAGIACTNKGTIRNVDVTWWRRTGYHYATDVNADITSFDTTRDARVAGIAAVNEGLISGCSVDGLTLKVCHGLSGGIAAYNSETGIIENCHSKDVKITFVYDSENYTFSGYEVDALVSMNLGQMTDNTYEGFISVQSGTFFENSTGDPALLPSNRYDDVFCGCVSA